jgi:pyruvate dehydrogenase E1 component
MLADEWDVAADVWSVTEGELNRDGVAIEKELLRHLGARPARPTSQGVRDAAGPVVAVSDWMRGVPEQIRPRVPAPTSRWAPTGSASDTCLAARRFFNTDAESVVVAVLEAGS